MSINFEDLDDGDAALDDMTVEGEVQRVSRQHVSSPDFVRLAQRSEETTSYQKLSHEHHHGQTTCHGPDRSSEDRKKRPKKARKLHLARLTHLNGDTKARVDRSVQTAHVKNWLHSHGYVVKADKLHPAVTRLIADWFNLVDQDGSRTLEHHELLAALKAARVPCDDATISEMIQMMDMNKDGVIDWDEFEVFMTEEFAAGKSLLSGEYLLPSGATINFGVMIGQLKRNRLLTDIMQDAQRRSKWASIAANPDALRRELAMLQEAADATSVATLERAKRTDAAAGGRPTTPRGVLAAAMMRSGPDGMGGWVPPAPAAAAGWGQQPQQGAAATDVTVARKMRIRDKLRACAAFGWVQHGPSHGKATTPTEHDKETSDDRCPAYGSHCQSSAGPSIIASLAAAGVGAHNPHLCRGPACPDPTAPGLSAGPTHSGQLRLEGSIGGYFYGASTAAAGMTADNINTNNNSTSPLASPHAAVGDGDLVAMSSAVAVSGLFALTSVSSGEHIAVPRQSAAIPSSLQRSTDPLMRPHWPAAPPTTSSGPCPRGDAAYSPEPSAWLLSGREAAYRIPAGAAATGAAAPGMNPNFPGGDGGGGGGSGAAATSRYRSTPPAFRRSPARASAATPGAAAPSGARGLEGASEHRHVLMPTAASIRQRRPLSRTMSHVAEMAKALRAQSIRLPPEALDAANTLPAAMLAGCAFTATTAATTAAATTTTVQPVRSSNTSLTNTSSTNSTSAGSRLTAVFATSGRFPTVDGYVPSVRLLERHGSPSLVGDGAGAMTAAGSLSLTALQRPATAAADTANATEPTALGGVSVGGDEAPTYSYGLTPVVLPAPIAEYSQMSLGLGVGGVLAAAGVVESEASDWDATATAATVTGGGAIAGPSGGRPGMGATAGFGSYLPDVSYSFAEERQSHSGPLTFGHTTTTVEPGVFAERVPSLAVCDSPFAREDTDSPAHQAVNDRQGSNPPQPQPLSGPAPPPQPPSLYASPSPHQLFYSGILPTNTSALQHNYFTPSPVDKALRPSASLARIRTGAGNPSPQQQSTLSTHSSLTLPTGTLRPQPPLYVLGSPSVSRTTSPPRGGAGSDATASTSGGANGPAPSAVSSCSSFPPSVASQGSVSYLGPAPASVGMGDGNATLLPTPNNNLPELTGSSLRRDGGGGVSGSIRRRGGPSGMTAGAGVDMMEGGSVARRQLLQQHPGSGRGRLLAAQLSVRSADADLTARHLVDIACGPWGPTGDFSRPGNEVPPSSERSAPAVVAGGSMTATAGPSPASGSGLSFAAARAGGGKSITAAADSGGVKRQTASLYKTVSTSVVHLGALAMASKASSAPCSASTVNTAITIGSAGTAATTSISITTTGGGGGGLMTPLDSMSGSEVLAWTTGGGDGANMLSSAHSGMSCVSAGAASGGGSRSAAVAAAALGPQASSVLAAMTGPRDVGSPSRGRAPTIPEVKATPHWGASTASLLQLRLAKHLDELLPRS